MRGSDHFGQIIYGESLQLATRFSLEEREFSRACAMVALVFGRPVQSRVSGQPVLPRWHGRFTTCMAPSPARFTSPPACRA